MADLAISRLALRVPAGAAAATRMRAEDALRIAANGDERLLIIRRLAIRRLRPAAGARAWNATVGGMIDDHRRSATHGGAAGAGGAAAVWFRSRAEAAALLLEHLADGTWPDAWFWRLAVQDWRGSPLEIWLPRALARFEVEPHHLSLLLCAMIAKIEAGSAPLLEALGRCAPLAFVRRADRDIGGVAALLAPVRRHIATTPLLAALLADAPAATGSPSLRAWIALALLVRHHSTMLSTPALLGSAIEALVEQPTPVRPLEPISTPEGIAAAARPPASAERASVAAGLLLVIRALVRLGLAEWLEVRPDRLARGFGRALLRHIAAHYRTDASDPVLEFVTGEDDEAWGADLIAWRIGLDRWLRRTARLRLHDLVQRHGYVLGERDRVLIRFPVAAADIRLRRRALDIDPGWTPWLGLVVLYVYRDEPLE